MSTSSQKPKPTHPAQPGQLGTIVDDKTKQEVPIVRRKDETPTHAIDRVQKKHS